MASVRYTKDHEYIRVEGDTAIVGITDYAQEQLGDVVFVELPEIGKQIEKGNFLQIWKLRGGKWQIVLDAFVPVPEQKN